MADGRKVERILCFRPSGGSRQGVWRHGADESEHSSRTQPTASSRKIYNKCRNPSLGFAFYPRSVHHHSTMPATAPPSAKSHAVPGYHTFIPANPQPIASLIKDTNAYPQNGGKIPRVYQELELRGTVFKNRLFAVCLPVLFARNDSLRLYCRLRCVNVWLSMTIQTESNLT